MSIPRRTVLILDDEPYRLNWARDNFARDPNTRWTVYLCETVDEFYEVLNSERSVDVALMDFGRSTYEGPKETVRQLQERGVKVGLITVGVSESDRRVAAHLGVPVFDILNLSDNTREIFADIANRTLEFIPQQSESARELSQK